MYTPYPCGYGRRDRYGNSSNHSLSERYTQRRAHIVAIDRYLASGGSRRQSSVVSLVITNFVYHRLASFPRFSLRYVIFLGEIRGQGRAGGEIRGGMVAVTHNPIWIREMKNTTY